MSRVPRNWRNRAVGQKQRLHFHVLRHSLSTMQSCGWLDNRPRSPRQLVVAQDKLEMQTHASDVSAARQGDVAPNCGMLRSAH